MNCTGLEVRLTEILGCRSDGNTCYSVSSAATMLFHGLPGGEMHGVMEEMERRGKSDSATISSAIDMGETETVGESHASRSRRLLGNFNSLCKLNRYSNSDTEAQRCDSDLVHLNKLQTSAKPKLQAWSSTQ